MLTIIAGADIVTVDIVEAAARVDRVDLVAAKVVAWIMIMMTLMINDVNDDLCSSLYSSAISSGVSLEMIITEVITNMGIYSMLIIITIIMIIDIFT